MADYMDAFAGKALSPREYLEHQMNMTDDEKAARRVFFEEQFRQFDEGKLKSQ